MNNRGADYIKRLLKDKERFKKWKRIMLALSCVVVFITVYALTIPAVTLACDKEEHVHTTECYNENNELICTKEEHTHSEDCYEKEEQEQEPVEEENEDVVQDETQVASNEEVTNPEEEQDTTEGEETTTKDPFVLNNPPKLDSVKVSYDENNKNNEGSSSGTLIPDSKYLKITVHFKDINASELKNTYGGSFSYTLPEFFRMTDTTPRYITDNNGKMIGNIRVEKGKAIVTYTDDYFKSLDKNATLSGSFFVEGAIDLSKLDKNNGTITFTKPDGDITLDYGLDYLEKYGDVKVEKHCSKDDKNSDYDKNSGYVKYTIKVTAGQDGSKNVYVVDKFTNNDQLVSYMGDISNTPTNLTTSPNRQNPYEERETDVAGKIYLTSTPTSDNEVPEPVTDDSSITKPGSLVWSIDKLDSNETRTLTYFVKLSDNQNLRNQSITNKASAFTKNGKTTYPKGQSEQKFTLIANYTMPKSIVKNNDKDYTKDEEGNYIIQYKLEFNLDSSSNYSLKNFVFMDYLNYHDYKTDDKMLPYISYERNSVELHKVTDNKDEKISLSKYKVEWGTDENNYKENWANTDGNPKRFRVTGSESNPLTIYPGDQYYVTYKLKVKPEVYAAMQSNEVKIINRYITNADNAKEFDNNSLNKVLNELKLSEYNWVQKTLDNNVTNKDQTINMGSSDIYVKKNGKYEKDTSVHSFEVPAGSYKYTVNVNQTMNQFNVTDATLKDELSSGIMHYVGYVKITPLKYDTTTNAYEDQKPKWVKINNETSFELKLSQIGWNDNNGYRFEYYAKTDDLSQVGQVAVTNKFTINGDVVGKTPFKFNDVSSSQTIQVKGHYSLSVNKSAWYYEKPQENATSWKNGKLYWVIKVEGSAIREGTQIKDVISSDQNLTDSFLHSNSIAGIYQGKPAQDINAYASFNDFLDANKGLVNKSDSFEQKFTNDKNFSGTDNNSELTLTANKTITLNNGESVYIVIRSEPQSLPTQYRDTFTYKNHAYKKDLGDTEFTECNSASQAIYGGPNILKELGQTFTYDGKKVSTIQVGADKTDSGAANPDKICKELLNTSTGNGAYISWAFKVNYAGDLKGDYRVLEDIPDGMELSYIRIKWHGDNAKKIESKSIDGLGTDWEVKSNTTTNDNGNTNQETTYYYNKIKNQALIKLGDFVDGKERDTYSVDVQVVCRVTDEKVLLGGEGKSFTNKVTLLSENGQTEIDKASDTATIKNNCLDKSHVQKGQRIDYTITANTLGQKLPLNDGDKLTLVDELGKNLELDPSTIKAVNESGKDVPIDKPFNPDTRVLEISIPNNEKVIITYTVTVKEAPETEATVSNKVYWKSYSDNGGKNDVIEKFTYSLNAGGSTDSTGNPQLTIKKVDQDNSNLMDGVTFDVYECELNGNMIQRVTSNNQTSGKTVNGIYSIDQSFITKYNTIYEIKETNTPKGYIEDKNSYYIVYLKKVHGKYPDYANSCKKYFEKQNNKYYIIAYTPKDFNPVIYNTQKGIVVKKAFINNAAGNVTKPVSGTYTFGLYEDAQGNGERIQTQTIKYSAGEAQEKTAKFINLELDKTYYVFELDDKGNPIVNSSQEVTINKLQYTVEYKNEKGESPNAAQIGQTVTVTNRSRTKILPSTGGYGSLLYRISGAMLALASLIYLTNIYKKNHLDDTSKKRRKK